VTPVPSSPIRSPLLFAVFLMSLSSLAFEVLLTRVFAISQWNHLAFMVISIALMGFAGAGTFLNILQARDRGRNGSLASAEAPAILSLFYAAAVILAFWVLNRLPLDYFRLPVEPAQIFYLLVAYGLLAIPFFFAGLVICAAYSLLPEKTGIAYFATMTGSACGAVLPALLLPFINEGRLIVISAVVPLLTIMPLLRPAARSPWSPSAGFRGTSGYLLAAAAVITGTAALLITTAPQTVAVHPSPYKAQSQILQLPDSRITESRNSINGLMTIVSSPYIRFAPGLSLTFGGELPHQTAVYRDGDNQLVLYTDLTPQSAEFAAFTLPYAGYRLVSGPAKVLIIQNGGGMGMACATAAGSRRVTLVDSHPERARIAAEHYRIPIVSQAPRQFLSRTSERFDVIQVETWGTSLPGSAALSQEYLLTIDALSAYLDHLSENGVIIISRRLLLPPSDLLRLWATAAEALRRAGVLLPGTHLAVLRSWDIYVMLVSRRPLHADEELIRFAEDLNFDWVYRFDMRPVWSNRYYVFDAPYHSLAVERLSEAYREGRETAYFDTYFMDVAPQTDNRPFPSRFLKWNRLKETYRATGSRMYTLLLSGEIVVVVIFLEAALLSLALLALPFVALRETGSRPGAAEMIYFLSLGIGFMFVELYFIKQLVLLYGDPVVSLTVVLAGMLVFSGVGGFLSQRLTDTALVVSLALLVTLLALAGPVTAWLTRAILPYPIPVNVVLGLVWLAVPGVLSGLPFPLAMRHLLKTPSARTYAWTANGCASVLASIAAAQLALSQGIAAIVIGGAAAYGVALICALKMRSSAGVKNSKEKIEIRP
jgi:spermidine synthase